MAASPAEVAVSDSEFAAAFRASSDCETASCSEAVSKSGSVSGLVTCRKYWMASTPVLTVTVTVFSPVSSAVSDMSTAALSSVGTASRTSSCISEGTSMSYSYTSGSSSKSGSPSMESSESV